MLRPRLGMNKPSRDGCSNQPPAVPPGEGGLQTRRYEEGPPVQGEEGGACLRREQRSLKLDVQRCRHLDEGLPDVVGQGKPVGAPVRAGPGFKIARHDDLVEAIGRRDSRAPPVGRRSWSW